MIIRKLAKRFIFATPQGTQSFVSSVRSPNSYKTVEDLSLSSIGMGTYIGPPDDITDAEVTEAIVEAVMSGVNVIDTAINYRYQKAERSVAKALQRLEEEYQVTKDSLFLATKIGYIPEDADKGIPGRQITEQLINEGKISADDVVGNVHCMHPNYLEDQLARSLDNLQSPDVDLLYLHNVAESQMPVIKAPEMLTRIKKAFEWCEEKRSQEKLRFYGLATWVCFRSPIDEQDIHLSLEKCVELAKEVAGEDHGFKFIQCPLNIIMPEIFIHKWQENGESSDNLLNVAALNKINVIASSSLLQGQVLKIPLDKTQLRLESQGGKHLQFIRSVPSSALKCSLVGMKNLRNVNMNCEVLKVDPLSPEDFWKILTPEGEEFQGKRVQIHLL